MDPVTNAGAEPQNPLSDTRTGTGIKKQIIINWQ